MNIFQKAFAGVNLTPGERALLKLLQSFANAGIITALLAVPAVLSANAGQPSITIASIGVIAGAFVHGFMIAWQKYVSAKGDAPLAQAIGAVDASLPWNIPAANAAKIEAPAPAE